MPYPMKSIITALLWAPLLTGCIFVNTERCHNLSAPGCADRTVHMKSSIYYLALETDYALTDKDGIFRNAHGKVIHRGSKEFKKMASIEGSARLMDGRVLSYHSKVRGVIRWQEVNAPYGLGAICPLIPMRSAAVDPRRIPLGSTIFIKETRGLTLPDGSKHDGLWRAVDTGKAIKGARIDLFAGVGKTSMRKLKDMGLPHMTTLTVRLVDIISTCK